VNFLTYQFLVCLFLCLLCMPIWKNNSNDYFSHRQKFNMNFLFETNETNNTKTNEKAIFLVCSVYLLIYLLCWQDASVLVPFLFLCFADLHDFLLCCLHVIN